MWFLVLTPLIAGILSLASKNLRSQVALSAAACVAALAGLMGVWTGRLASPATELVLPGIRLSLVSGGIGVVLAGFALLLWLSSLLFSLRWFQPHQDNSRYMMLLGVTCTGILMTFLGGDFLTLYMGFEMMSLASWGLVIHTQNQKAYSAGRLYLYLGVVGGLLVLTSLALIYFYTGSFSFAAKFPANAPTELIFLMMVVGFGVKAGMVPVHIWLPEAHPAAPVPASALLSGILIKTGAYGIFRTLGLAASVPAVLHTLGLTVLLLGIVTMTFGVVFALIQHEAKRMLAFHSISQMGYILTGLGAAAFLGAGGAEGLVGAAYHVINHSVFKALLFLTAGAVYLYTHHLNLYKLGGIYRLLPVTFIFAMIAAMGITGFPGFNGFASKTIIHHSLLSVVETMPALAWTEKVFTLVSAGTVCSFIKFIWFLFLAKPKEEYPVPEKKVETWPLVAGMGLLATAVVILGAFPRLVVEKLLVPALSGLQVFGISHYQPHIYSAVSLLDIGIAFILGAVIFWAGVRWNLFHVNPPKWFSMQYWGSLVLRRADTGMAYTEKSWHHLWAAFERRFFRLEHAGEVFLQHLDSHPKNRVDRALSIINLNFDTLMVMAVLSLILLLYFS